MTKPFRFREKGCSKRFSVRVGTVMQDFRVGYRTRAIAVYLFVTSLKAGMLHKRLHYKELIA